MPDIDVPETREIREVALAMLVTPTEAERIRRVVFRHRLRLSGWMRQLVLRETEQLERRPGPRDSQPAAG